MCTLIVVAFLFGPNRSCGVSTNAIVLVRTNPRRLRGGRETGGREGGGGRGGVRIMIRRHKRFMLLNQCGLLGQGTISEVKTRPWGLVWKLGRGEAVGSGQVRRGGLGAVHELQTQL